MSNSVIDACRALKMPPPSKAVLMAMADYANDHGECWPSITTLCEFTCFGKTAVIAAIKWLEDHKLVSANRDNGRHTTYVITPKNYENQSASRTGSSSGPVRLADDTRPSGEPDPSASRTGPVRQTDTNHQEPSRTISKATPKKSAPVSTVAMPDGVDPQTWADWLALRKAKKAPVTETVLRGAIAEAAKASMPLTRFLEIWCSRGSQGLQAEWLKPNERSGPGVVVPIRPSASADFRGKTYAATAIEDLPPDLREAARAAIADG